MHDEDLVARGALTSLHHDLFEKREENIHQLIQGSAVLLNVELVCFKNLFEGQQTRNQDRLILDALLNSVAHLLNRVFPVLREINLCNVVNHAAECASIQF